ncbi:MAG: glutamine--tRNA ligase/YqeY domain fusion protein [Oligoflexus sp.]
MADKLTSPAPNFIRNIINEDIKSGKNGGQVVVRFPPEPNGYLHIGHAKSICFNFGLAQEYPGGKCYLRFDDTNPLKESEEYTNAIQRDISWLGFDWEDRLTFASDYFPKLYELARQLILDGKAFVCSLNAEQVREYRGTLTEPGKESPDRNRSIEENLDLFERMKKGEFPENTYTLRAKIDMSSGNINMRDPALYRIRKVKHHRTGDQWCIYPMYDYTHPISDALEGVTHSLCTLEFQDHRPLYDWFIENCRLEHKPQQIEFARLNVNYTITSKRKLKALVDGNYVSSWNDPRMPTISGLRRRGYTPAALRNFSERIGVSKKETVIDMSILEEEVRNDLNENALRTMVVIDPLKVVIENFPEDEVQEIEVANHPQKPELGSRKIHFSREIYIERDDFMEVHSKQFFRLAPGQDVRLRYGYVISCQQVIKDADGNIQELRCTYHPETFAGKKPADGRKVKGIIHWVSAAHATDIEVRLYDRLFLTENPGSAENFLEQLNPNSLQIMPNAKAEAGLREAAPETLFQFERLGYFSADQEDHRPDRPVFNRTVTLRDTWSKDAK